MDKLLSDDPGTDEIEMTIRQKCRIISLRTFNSKGEEVDIYYSLVEKKFAYVKRNYGTRGYGHEIMTV